MTFDRRSVARGSDREGSVSATKAVGKATLTEQLTASPAASGLPHPEMPPAERQLLVETPRTAIASVFGGAVQQQARGGPATGDVHGAAARGLGEPATSLPFASEIQASFGPNDVSSVQAHIGGGAATAAAEMGAAAYATGNHVAFARAPDLHLAAHEAAHVVQQRAGVQLKNSVGESGDAYEQHADAVADRVVKGQSAAPLLEQLPGCGGSRGGSVQRRGETTVQLQAEGEQQKDPKAEAERVKKLIADYDAAIASPKPNWAEAAKLLNGFNDQDIQTRLRKLSPEQLAAMIDAAKKTMQTWHERVTKPAEQILEEKRVAKLAKDYDAAVAAGNWSEAAKLLNGFNDEDIHTRLHALDRKACVAMLEGAVTSMFGWHARVTKAIKSLYPGDVVAMDKLIEAAEKVVKIEKKFQVDIVPREKWGATAPDKSKGWDEYPKDAPPPLWRIVVHHTADPLNQTAKELQDKEMKAGYADLPYHFVITANGIVHEGRKIEVVGAHAGEIKGNKDITKDPDYGSIGIVLTGDFESRMKNVWTPDKPTSAQLASLQHLLNHLTQKYKIDPKNIIKHSEVMRGGDPTVCPGAELGPHVDEQKKVAGDDTRLLEDAKAELDKARAALK